MFRPFFVLSNLKVAIYMDDGSSFIRFLITIFKLDGLVYLY